MPVKLNMRINRTKARLSEGEVVAGVALQQYRSTEIPRLLAAVGFDWLFVDTEHGGFSLEISVERYCCRATPATTSPSERRAFVLLTLINIFRMFPQKRH